MKTTSRLFFYFIIFLLGLILAVQITPVQTYLSKQFLKTLSEKTNHKVSVSSVRIKWLDRAELSDFLILDGEMDTLAFAEQIMLNYRIKDLFNRNLLNIEGISAEHLRLQLIKHDSLSPLNLIEFINSIRNKDRVNTKSIRVEEVVLENFEFSISDRTREPKNDRLDFAHLEMDFSDFQLSEISLVKDSIEAQIVQITGKERNTDFVVKELQTSLSLNSQSLSLTKLNFRTPTSQISDSIKLYYNGLDDLSHFVDSVSFGFYLSNTIISQRDIALFSGNNSLKSDISIDGIIWGTVGDFNMDQSKIGFGEESFIEGGVSCYGLPNLKSTFILADITHSHLVPTDIKDYFGEIHQNISRLGKVDFTGSFAGFLNDFVARGDFVTEEGSVHSDINLKIPDNRDNISYSGNLELKNVDLGAFLNNRRFIQEVNMKGKINGKGITAENANFDLNAIIFESSFGGYKYDSIRANGTFASNLFRGNFSIDDPNCKVKGYANLDFGKEEEILKLNLNIDSTDLNKLNLVLDTLVTGGKISIDIVNLNMDQFTGIVKIDSAFLKVNNNKILVDSVEFTASLANDQRLFKLSFPGVEAQLQGKFKISDALKDLTMLGSDYISKIGLSTDTLIERGSGESYKMEFFAQVDNMSQYLDSLNIPIEIPNGSFVEATFRESKNTNLFIYAKADYLKFGKHTIYNPVLEANGSRELGSDKILTNFILESDLQEFSGVPDTRDLLVEGVWLDDNVELITSIKQDETNSNFRIKTYAKLTKDSILIKMQPSEVIAFGDEWTFTSENAITIYPKRIKIENLEIHDATESIEVTGIYSMDERTKIDLKVKNLSLDKANLFYDLDIRGLLDGEMYIFRENSDESFQFDGGFQANELNINDFLVGNITGTSKWNPDLKNIYSKVVVDRKNFKSIDLRGYYFPLRKENQLSFELKFDQADLRLALPFVNERISDLSGFAEGGIKIIGSLRKPQAIGDCMITDGKMKVNYLNTIYSFAGDLKFEPDLLRFENFNVVDRKEAQAKVGGTISHNFFKNVVTNISLDADNFEFLNTTAIDNSLFYGSTNGTGIINVTGPLNDLLIKASIKTEKGTRFFIPITEGGEVSQQEYIAFLDFMDTTKTGIENQYTLQGLTLDFDIEVTPDAYCELIFDIKTGDIIRGRGRGNIKLSLDTDGEFQMFGPLEITDGAYNFTVPGFINKEFDVTSGSQITWFGDPYNAIIDLNAVYLQRASFEPLKTDDNDGGGEFDDKIGMKVMLELQGGMLAPLIDFDLQIADKIDESTRRKSKLSQIVNDEQELKRQVISLLFFKRFSPLSSFTLGGGGNVGNSVSEFFSNQVSYLVSQLDENLEVEVDLASLDKDAFNTFQLRLAYTFLDGRLKVTRGGNFQNEQGSNDKLLNDIVGDWSVEYSLTRDGRLRAKVFKSTNQQTSTNLGEQNYETGISLRFVHSFNEFKSLLTSKRDEAIKREQERQGSNPNDLGTLR